MKFLYDFLPIIIFFVAYKLFGIYPATAAAIVVSVLQVLGTWWWTKKLETMQIVTLAIIILLGGATLVLHNPIFIKWKPTIVNWIFALLFLGSHFIGDKPLIQRMMGTKVDLPDIAWRKMSLSWVWFFAITGLANILVAYHASTNTWVNFKLFGILGLTVIFVIIQAFMLAKHINTDKTNTDNS